MRNLLMKAYGKLTVPNALGQELGDPRRFLFAVGDDQLAKGCAQGRIGEGIHVNPIEQCFGKGFADIVKRSATRVGGRKFAKGLGKRSDHHETVYR
jgi:hypothetical protein